MNLTSALGFAYIVREIETVKNTCSCEFSGCIVRIGSKVSGFAVGDRVVSCALGYFATYECVPAWACCKIQEYESFAQMASTSAVSYDRELRSPDPSAASRGRVGAYPFCCWRRWDCGHTTRHRYLRQHLRHSGNR